jgi:hypothetical protein
MRKHLTRPKQACLGCQKQFTPKNERQRYCGYSCSGRANAHLAGIVSAEDRFWAKVKKTDTCWLWTAGKGRFGYGKFARGSSRQDCHITTAHRFSYELHNGPIPDGLCVLHRCDVPACVNPDHLFLGTRKDNSADMAAKGRAGKGERHSSVTHPERVPRGRRHWNAKLTAGFVQEIRRRVAGNESQASVARSLGLSVATVNDIIKERTWTHVV